MWPVPVPLFHSPAAGAPPMRFLIVLGGLLLAGGPLLPSVAAAPTSAAASASAKQWLARAIAQVYEQPDSALLLARQVVTLARAAHDPLQEGSAWNCIGAVHYTRDVYRPALRAYTQALQCFEAAGNRSQQAAVLNNLGSLCLTMDLHEASYRYFQQALAMELALQPDSTGAALCLGGSGVALAALNRLPEALDCYRRTLALYRREHDRASEAQTLSYVGAVYVKQQRFAEALQTFEKVQQMGVKSADGLTNLEVLQGLGDAYRGLGQWAKAAGYYEARLRADPEMPGNLHDSFKRLADVQHRAGNDRAAYQALRRFVGLNDTLNDREAARRLTDLEARYRTRDLQRANQVQRLTIARKNQLAAFGFGTAALVLLAAGALAWLFVQRTRANRQLALANATISRADAQKEVLLQEIHHRVKNNLQLVGSLLGWQAETTPAAAPALAASQARLHSMALIHEHLYRADDLSHIRLDQYLGQLLQTLQAAHVSPQQAVQLTTAIEPLAVEAKDAIPLGLITNELVANTYKHAFRGRLTGHLHVALTAQGRTGFRLTLTDDGVGLLAHLGPKPAAELPSLGMQLVRTLSRQLRATFTIEPNPPTGTRFCIERRSD